MTPRQTRFVAEYAKDGNAAAAARRAGYSARSARVNGPRLLSNAAVQKAIHAQQRCVARKLELEREQVVQGLLGAVETARQQTDPGNMIRGWAEIGRLLGYYGTERPRKIDINILAKRAIEKIETMTDEELLRVVGVVEQAETLDN